MLKTHTKLCTKKELPPDEYADVDRPRVEGKFKKMVNSVLRRLAASRQRHGSISINTNAIKQHNTFILIDKALTDKGKHPYQKALLRRLAGLPWHEVEGKKSWIDPSEKRFSK